MQTEGNGEGKLVMTNMGSGDLSVLDEASLEVERVVPVGGQAWGVAVAPQGDAAFVSYAEGLAFVDLAEEVVNRRVRLGGQGMALALSRDGATCFVAVHGGEGDRLVAVDREYGAIAGEVPIGEGGTGPWTFFGMTLSPDGETLFVPEHEAFAYSVIQTHPLHKLRVVPLAPLGRGGFAKPHYFAVSPDGATLYHPFEGRVLAEIDASTFEETDHPLSVDAHQHGVAISPDGGRLYTVNNPFGGQGSLSEIETEGFRETRRIPLEGHHEQVALDGGGRHAYLTGGYTLGGRAHDDLTVVDLGSGSAVRVRAGGRRPLAVVRTGRPEERPDEGRLGTRRGTSV